MGFYKNDKGEFEQIISTRMKALKDHGDELNNMKREPGIIYFSWGNVATSLWNILTEYNVMPYPLIPPNVIIDMDEIPSRSDGSIMHGEIMVQWHSVNYNNQSSHIMPMIVDVVIYSRAVEEYLHEEYEDKPSYDMIYTHMCHTLIHEYGHYIEYCKWWLTYVEAYDNIKATKIMMDHIQNDLGSYHEEVRNERWVQEVLPVVLLRDVSELASELGIKLDSEFDKFMARNNSQYRRLRNALECTRLQYAPLYLDNTDIISDKRFIKAHKEALKRIKADYKDDPIKFRLIE